VVARRSCDPVPPLVSDVEWLLGGHVILYLPGLVSDVIVCAVIGGWGRRGDESGPICHGIHTLHL
jgi:hypothetical protein